MASYKLPRKQVIALMKGEDDNDLFYKTLKNLSDTITSYRKKHNLTNKQLADLSGITTSVMSRVESGYQNISLSTVCKVLSVIDKEIVFKDTKKEKDNPEV